jgi:hypothetical protein
VGHLIWYGAIALALSLSVGLFISAKAELDRLRKRAEGDREVWKAALATQQEQFEALRAELRDLAGQQRFMQAPMTPVALNVSKRNHALRMCRGGQSAEDIAGSLGIPQDEVKLLLKVHQIVLESV